MSTRTKNIAWTLALVVFLGVPIYGRLRWLSLVIPGALLVWYGLIASDRAQRIETRKSIRSGLH